MTRVGQGCSDMSEHNYGWLEAVTYKFPHQFYAL